MLTKATVRRAFVAGASLAVLIPCAPAYAGGGWGYTRCTEVPNPGCELGVGHGGSMPAQPQAPNGHAPANPHPMPNRGPQGDTVVGGNPNLAHCGYVRTDFTPSGGVATTAFEAPDRLPTRVLLAAAFRAAPAVEAVDHKGNGAWYVYKCSSPGWHDALYRPPVWMAEGPSASGLPPVAVLAEQARQQLRLPTPSIQANPHGEQLVRLPTWLWLERGGWQDVSATASVPGEQVTALARPREVTWLMGDGDTVTCHGPGTPFPNGGDPAAASPTCGHTYRSSSAGQPGQSYPVRAIVRWTITWSGAGQSGTFPDLTTSATAVFRVAEAQALNSFRR